MYETVQTLDPTAEARAKVEADVSAALQESFVTNAEHVTTKENGTEGLTLFIEPRPSVIAQVDVDRGPVDDAGSRVTIMKLAPIARAPHSGSKGLRMGNGQVHANVWRLIEHTNMPPRFEAGQVDAKGAFTPFDDELMASDETVASFGGYWPANLRQGVPENPMRRSRGLGRLVGKAVLRHALPALQHRNYYRP